MPKANKVIRLESGRFITTKVTFSTEETLARAHPGEIWQSADGRRVIVREMETKHITNALKSMERHYLEHMPLGLQVPREEALALLTNTRPIYGTMLEELARRAKQFAKVLEGRAAGIPDKPNPKGRKFDFEL